MRQFFLSVCLVIFVSAPAHAQPAFVKKPTAIRIDGLTRIDFTVDRATDVAVTIENANGKIIRHLAGGVLGKNAPEPLKSDTLAQSLSWDGKDDFGKFLLKTLVADGVNVRSVERTANAMTGMLYINVTPDGQRTFFGSRGANQLVGRLGRRELRLLGRAQAASLMGYSFLNVSSEAAAHQIIAAVHRNNGWVSLDVGMEPSKEIPEKILRVAKTVDLLFVSSEEAMTLAGRRNPEKAFHFLLQLGVPQVVMKLGRRGCSIIDDGALRQVPSFPVRAVDSTGAGDAFTAAFLQGRLRGWRISEAALAANAAGAAAAGVVGAGERLPTVQQIVRILSAQRLKKPWEAVRLAVLRHLGGGVDGDQRDRRNVSRSACTTNC